MPCQSIPFNGKLLAGCGKKKPSGEPETPVSRGKEIRAGEVYGRTVSFRLPDKHRGTLSGGTMSGLGHAACRSGRQRTPGRDSPCAKVQAQDSESPFTHVRDCRGKPDPKGNAPTIIRKHELTVITYFLKVIRIMALFRNFETSNEHGYE